MPDAKTRFTIVGAGPSGCLLAIYLARRGFDVQVYERRGDMRREVVDVGKSIKMTLAERGLHALGELGLTDEVMRFCVPLRGRAVHSGDGAVTYISYGKDEREVIYSFSRTDLNSLLLDQAEACPNVRLFFHQRCTRIDKESATAFFHNDLTGEETEVKADAIAGSDGAFSVVRQQMHRNERADYRQDYLRWGYKELSILAGPDGSYQMDKNALHIWPCGDYMLFALPNVDGSFNGVCVLPFQGEHSFEVTRTDEDVLDLFEEHFGDALPYMPDILTEFWSRKTSDFLTIRTSRWHHKGKVVLVGDAVHTVVPFYGQGMNAGFEDCSILVRCLDRHPGDLEAAFTEYQALRKHNTDALAELSTRNFDELRDTVRSAVLAARKKTAIVLNKLFPRFYLPLYTMVSHSNRPYADCVARARKQERIARWLGADLLVGFFLLWVWIERAKAHRRAARKARLKKARPQPVRPAHAVHSTHLDARPALGGSPEEKPAPAEEIVV
jgi:kynurenine 3-monooxygenase